MSTPSLTIGPLVGGGLVLGYRCLSRCRHCLYDAGPWRRDGIPADEAALDALLDQLAARAPRARYHIGGGEPFLDPELLLRAVAGMGRRGLALDYVETSAAWVRGADHADGALEALAAEGLGCVLVSLTPFHAEFIAPERTLALIEAAERVRPRGAFVWILDFLPDLRQAPPGSDGRIDLEALLARRGAGYARQLAQRYSVMAAGRAGRFLHGQGQRVAWQAAARAAHCRERLQDTTHFHVGTGRGATSRGCVPGWPCRWPRSRVRSISRATRCCGRWRPADRPRWWSWPVSWRASCRTRPTARLAICAPRPGGSSGPGLAPMPVT